MQGRIVGTTAALVCRSVGVHDVYHHVSRSGVHAGPCRSGVETFPVGLCGLVAGRSDPSGLAGHVDYRLFALVDAVGVVSDQLDPNRP